MTHPLLTPCDVVPKPPASHPFPTPDYMRTPTASAAVDAVGVVEEEVQEPPEGHPAHLVLGAPWRRLVRLIYEKARAVLFLRPKTS